MNNKVKQIVRFFAGRKNPYRFFARFSIIYVLFILLLFTYNYDYFSPDYRQIPYMQMVILSLITAITFVFIHKEYDRRCDKGEMLPFDKWNEQKRRDKLNQNTENK